MAARWSSESVVAEHRELQANAMALDRRGEFTLLAGRRTLALIRLDSPSKVVKRASRTQQKYDVTAAEWNPTSSQGHTFVLACGERAEICQWTEGALNGTSSLRAHTRTITDLNWHRMDPNLLATCSIDTFVHIWDTREPRKPVASLSSIAGASQVKWNKLNHNLLASGHDCDVRVWDNRKPTQPTQFISAHLSKIQGLDWSPNHESHLVTSSNDCTVKFFDIMNPRKAENFINTLSPVWRARYTPFGEGVVTVVAPQLRRGENPLLLWAVRDVTAPVHTFVGHSDMVLEFEWRLSGGAGGMASGPGEHQLVTWARDHSLRIWRVDQHLQRLCGDEAGLGESADSEFTSEAATLVESVFEGEADQESGVLREDEDTHSLSDGNDEDAESNSPRYGTDLAEREGHEGDAQTSVVEESTVYRVSLESSSTTEASEVTVAATAIEKPAGENVSAASSLAGTPSLPGLAIAKPLSSPASTLPSGQPMSLQQEFSLLNTSLDSSQVNSVEVVATEREGQQGVGEPEEEVVTVKEEVIDEEEAILEKENCHAVLEIVTVKEEVEDEMEHTVEEKTAEEQVPLEEESTVYFTSRRDTEEEEEEENTASQDATDEPTKENEDEAAKGGTAQDDAREKEDEDEGDITERESCLTPGGSQENEEEDTTEEESKELKGEDAVEAKSTKQSEPEESDTPEEATLREGNGAKEATQGKDTEEKGTSEVTTEDASSVPETSEEQDGEQKQDHEEKGDTKLEDHVEGGDSEEHAVEDTEEALHEEDGETEGHNVDDGEVEQSQTEEGEPETEGDAMKEQEERDEERESTLEVRIVEEGTAKEKQATEEDDEQRRLVVEEKEVDEERGAERGGHTEERESKQGQERTQEAEAQQGSKVVQDKETTSDLHPRSGEKRKAVDGSPGQGHTPAAKRKPAAAVVVDEKEVDRVKYPKLRKIQLSASPRVEDEQSQAQEHGKNEYDDPDSTCVIKIHCMGEDKGSENITVVEASGSGTDGTAMSPHKISIKSAQDKAKETSKSDWDTVVSLNPGEEGFESEEAVIHVECDPEVEMLEEEAKRKDDSVAVCQVVTSGSFVIKGAASSLMQVEASVVHLPESLTNSSQTPEEVWGSLAPQLLEGGIIVPGENLVLGVLSLVTMVEAVEVDGEAQTQITISPLAEPVEAYHQRGVNFILVTKNYEAFRSSGASEAHAREKTRAQNAPHSDSPGQFQCDKCDKTYSVRSSLNSHRVTHNAEKMFKCDECDRSFHYSTPLMIHKRSHSGERPYSCQTCHASFKFMTNLRCHERQHTGERPITCPECSRGFRDHTSLKRHRQRMHQTEASDVSSTASPPNSSQKEPKAELEEDDQKAKSPTGPGPKERDSGGQGNVGRLSDYIHKCGLCQMTCHTRPQMLTHLQVHAAAERFRCRYCTSAYTFRFLLARHVREMHPGRPQWFCQHCDRIFDTCRKMNSHSCRSVRGNYSCPHDCGFTTEVRHRVFRHVARHHPEDAAPYHCDFCTNSYRDPGRLRYHQKRQHPEKMPELAPPPKDTWRAESSSGPEDKGAVDMSQVEVSVVGEAIEYYLPEDLRNDMAFMERVKFKCFYCEAKFPVKNAMTRHVLRAHPGQRAYKCLRCNVFFRSNTESKNHNRKYHKYQDTGGRDPHRNEKAMKKRAQAVEEQLRHAAPSLRSAFKFRCLYCPMAYRCKRPLVAHYRRWHPNQEWDHLPDRPSGSLSASGASSKRRRLLFFDCDFDSECGRTFDDFELVLEHLLHAHEVSGSAALSHVKERMVVEEVRRGRLPKNAVLMSDETMTGGASPRKRHWWKGRKRVKSEAETDGTEEEQDFDEEDFDELTDEPEDDMEGELLEVKEEVVSSGNSADESDRGLPLNERSMNLESIDSVGDVKKMLYRCRRCGISCSSKAQYRQHTASHTNPEKEQDKEAADQEQSEKEQEDQPTKKVRSKPSRSPEKVPVLGGTKKKTKKSDASEGENQEGGILITSMKEEVNDDEDYVTVLTLTSSASGQPMVRVEPSALVESKTASPKKEKAAKKASQPTTPPSPPLSSSSSPSSPQTPRSSTLRSPSRGASKPQVKGQVVKRKAQPPSVQRKVVAEKGRPASHKGKVERRGGAKQQGSLRRSRTSVAKKLQCPDCSMSFKTRSEVSFHRRLDH